MPFNEPKRLTKNDASTLMEQVDNFLFDCDGVLWHWPKCIDGSIDFINHLKANNKRCFFLTNNSTKTRARLVEMLKQSGVVNVSEDECVNTSWLLAQYLKGLNYEGKVFLVGNEAMANELDLVSIKHSGLGCNRSEFPDPRNFDFVNNLELDGDVRCVCVGYDFHFNYPKIVLATSYCHKVPNCLFLATNDDATLPTNKESKASIPGCGTFVKALETSVGRPPILLGKPNEPMWQTLMRVHGLDADRTCMIGDRLETDIAFAANNKLGYSIAVLSGITNESEILEKAKHLKLDINSENAKCVPDFYVEQLGEIIKILNN
jgi:phosphoglycolate/pyridoxal phosphate phosphatase family enzyme